MKEFFLRVLGAKWAWSFSQGFFISHEDLSDMNIEYNKKIIISALEEKNIDFTVSKEGFQVNNWNYENFRY